MAKPTYAPGTEYIVTMTNGDRIATGGFDGVQSLFEVINSLWDGKVGNGSEGSITAWTIEQKVSWNKIDTYEVLINPSTVVAILDLRGTDSVAKLGV